MTSDSTRESLKIVGGIVYPRRRGPLARGWVSWPYARLTLDASGVMLAPRGLLKPFFPHVGYRYGELAFVKRVVPPRFLHFAEEVRFQPVSAEARVVYFSTWPGQIERIVQALRSHGVDVR